MSEAKDVEIRLAVGPAADADVDVGMVVDPAMPDDPYVDNLDVELEPEPEDEADDD